MSEETNHRGQGVSTNEGRLQLCTGSPPSPSLPLVKGRALARLGPTRPEGSERTYPHRGPEGKLRGIPGQGSLSFFSFPVSSRTQVGRLGERCGALPLCIRIVHSAPGSAVCWGNEGERSDHYVSHKQSHSR